MTRALCRRLGPGVFRGVVLLVLCVRPGWAAEPAEAPATAFDHSLDPPPPPPRLTAKILLGSGAGLLVGGFVGTLVSPGCATHDARGGCLDARGSHPVFPVMMAAGLVLTVVGSALWRQDAPAPP